MHDNLLQFCLSLCASMYHSLPGSSVHGFSRQGYWSGLPGPPSGDFPEPGIKPMSLMSPALLGRFFTTSATWEVLTVTRSKNVRNSLHVMSLNIMGGQQSM